MSDIVEAVAKAMKARLIEKGVWMRRDEHRGVVAIQVYGHVDFEDLAHAAIEAYEAATADQDERDRRVIWEAVERMNINPPDTPLMDALKSGRLYE